MSEMSLAGVVRRQLKVLLRHLPSAQDGKVRSVHQARVASRRLREVLPVAGRAAPAARKLKLGRLIRRITGALGPVRELDVALLVFDDDEPQDRERAAAVEKIRAHLTAERDRRARAMRTKLGRINHDGLEARITALAKACEASAARDWSRWLIARLRKRGGNFAEAVKAAGTLYSADPIHRVRIAAKKLRYTLELAQLAAGAPVGREIASLRRLQDLLGRLRDLQVLEEHLRAMQLEQVPTPAIAAAVDEINEELEAECRSLHAQFVRRVDAWLVLAAKASRDIPASLVPRQARKMAGIRSGQASSRRRTA